MSANKTSDDKEPPSNDCRHGWLLGNISRVIIALSIALAAIALVMWSQNSKTIATERIELDRQRLEFDKERARADEERNRVTLSATNSRDAVGLSILLDATMRLGRTHYQAPLHRTQFKDTAPREPFSPGGRR